MGIEDMTHGQCISLRVLHIVYIGWEYCSYKLWFSTQNHVRNNLLFVGMCDENVHLGIFSNNCIMKLNTRILLAFKCFILENGKEKSSVNLPVFWKYSLTLRRQESVICSYLLHGRDVTRIFKLCLKERGVSRVLLWSLKMKRRLTGFS